MLDLMNTGTGILLDMLEAACCELGILQVSDAPDAELKNAQSKVDRIKQELDRRLSW